MTKESVVWEKERVLFYNMEYLYFVSSDTWVNLVCPYNVYILFRWSLHLFSFSCSIVDIIASVSQMLRRNCVSHFHRLQQKCQLTNSTISLHILHFQWIIGWNNSEESTNIVRGDSINLMKIGTFSFLTNVLIVWCWLHPMKGSSKHAIFSATL